MTFCHLHVHSDYSLLRGLATIDDLLDAAQKHNMSALALTDSNCLYGAVDFTVKAKERGITPILGAEILVAPNGMVNAANSPSAREVHQLVLLVENATGYQNLMQIITTGQLESSTSDPRVDYDVLRAHHEGLIALSGGDTGEIAAHLVNGGDAKAEEKALLYQEIFGEGNFFLEMQDHPNEAAWQTINDGLVALHKKTGIPLVACGNVHYVAPEDRETHDVLYCIGQARKVDEIDRPRMTQYDLSFRTPEEMQKVFGAVDGALANTLLIAERCAFDMPLGQTILPIYPLPDGVSAEEELRRLCEEGLETRYGAENITAEHRERMDYEMGIIEKTGYASYFLIVQDFVNWAKDNGIVVGPGRGSAAGSFVSYLTGITNMDPIVYKLLFERFLNPERVSMPDVDLDFADDRRDEVLEYCRHKYGADHVAQIITFGTMAARAAIRDAGRALGFSYDFCDRVAKLIPMFTSIEKTLEEVPDFLRLYNENVDAKDLIDVAKKIEGLHRHSSVHACGAVITDKPVVAYSPLQRMSGGGEDATVTQYASSTKFSAVEKIGLLKMDFLGLRNLTIIQNTIKIVKAIHGTNIDIDTISLNDDKTYELLQAGNTTGIFQLESSGMRRYLKQLKPTTLEDIIAMVALYRPGPMEWIPDFVAGKHGEKKVEYLHPKLEEILEDTYGVAVYQEQVMRIAQDLAGFTLGEADILRKAMGKKIIELIQEQKIKFVEGCVAQGVDKSIAEQVFAFIEPFAGYGFNRSHAACYALIGYQTAYLKAHYTPEFMAALLASTGDNDRIALIAAECRDIGLEVRAPDVNESFADFAVIYDPETKEPYIRFGLGAIKNVGRAVAEAIVEERKVNGPYKDFSAFLERVDSKDLNKKSIEALAMVGAFDTLVSSRSQILASMDAIITFIKDLHASAHADQGSLFGAEMLSRATVKLAEAPPAGNKQRLDWEKQLLGVYVSDHPANEYRAFFDKLCTPLSTITEEHADEMRTVGGIIISISTILTKKDAKTMAFVTIEDGFGAVECIVFPRLYEETKDVWEDGKAVCIGGKVNTRDGELKILSETVKEITADELRQAKSVDVTSKKYAMKRIVPTERLTLTLPDVDDPETIPRIKKVLDDCEPGTTQILLSHKGKLMKTEYCIDADDDAKKKLAEIGELE